MTLNLIGGMQTGRDTYCGEQAWSTYRMRDYFAAAALPTITYGTPAMMATMAYKIADAMLVEREKGVPTIGRTVWNEAKCQPNP